MMSRKKLFSVNTKPDHPFYPNTDRKPFMTDLRHLSREEQKLLADVALLVQNDDQEFNYEMLKAAAPDEASGEFWFRMAETLSTLPPNRSLDLRLNGGRLTVAVSILSVLLQDSPEIPQLWAQKVIALNYLAHGHQTRARGLAQQADKAAEANEEEYLAKTLSQNLLSTLKDALERFPEDTWFAEMRDDAWKHFGAEQAV